MVNANGQVFFSANDGVHGNELWRTDGTADGTTLVADIQTGGLSSNPQSLVDVGGTVYFAAAQTGAGVELWKSNGTEAGTTRVADIRAGLLGSNPEQLVNAGGTLFFTADNGVSGRELWRTYRGTTSLVKDIRPGSAASGISNLTAAGTRVYFQANDGVNGAELWTSDGTPAGTVMVKNIASGSSSSLPDNFIEVGGIVYFQAADLANGRELWRSDGTFAGTYMVRNIRPLSLSSSPDSFVNVNGTLFFRANDGSTGAELWKSDGTTAGTMRVADINAGPSSSQPGQLTNVNGKLFFRAIDTLNDAELWTSDGTTAGTMRVKNIGATTSSFPVSLANVNGLLYFAADDGLTGNELYRSDGTSAGTFRIANLISGFAGGNPQNILAVGQRVYLSSQSNSYGREVFTQSVLAGTENVDFFTLDYSQSNQVKVSRAATARAVPEVLGIFSPTMPLDIDGLAGNDSVRVIGTSSADTILVDAFGVHVNGSLVKLSNFEAITLAGMAGDDTYQFTADVPLGSYRLDESAGGFDTLDFSTTQAAIKLNMNLSALQGINPNLKLNLLSASTFERVVGGQGNDVIVGNAQNNILEGGPGNDTLSGGQGNDQLFGGGDNDTLNGSVGDDWLSGGTGDDKYLFNVVALDEVDQLVEQPGEGIDTLDFTLQSTPVTLNLGLITLQTVHSHRKLTLNSLVGFENAWGGSSNDVLIGNDLANVLDGQGGDDNLKGGLGDDVYRFGTAPVVEFDQISELGAAGRDTLDFSTLSTAVTVDLGTTSIQNVHTNRTLKLSSATVMENILGGSADDVLTGNGAANVLIGNAGNDQLIGLGKRDLLIGGTGLDTITGGDDEDLLIAGRSIHDALVTNLNQLIDQWNADGLYTDRILSLRAGVGPMNLTLKKNVDVLDDAGDLDSLTGSGSLDWYFRALSDVITDLNGEVVDELV